MSANDDKYPDDSGRRRFVKGVVGGATLAGVGAGGAATVNSLTTSPGAGGGATEAMAIERIAGPAPRGMPLIPIEIDDEGNLKGVWPEVSTETVQGQEFQVARMEIENTDVTYSSEWYQYCGMESYEGIQPDFESDNYFLYDGGSTYEWQTDKSEGDQFNVDDFEDYEEWGNEIGAEGIGKPATATWRSEDTDSIIPVTILRSSLIEEAAQDSEYLQATAPEGFLAWVNKCTHFCCVPGYKSTNDSARYDAEDKVYCQCHQSVYDPFSIVKTLFISRPRPDDDDE